MYCQEMPQILGKTQVSLHLQETLKPQIFDPIIQLAQDSFNHVFQYAYAFHNILEIPKSPQFYTFKHIKSQFHFILKPLWSPHVGTIIKSPI